MKQTDDFTNWRSCLYIFDAVKQSRQGLYRQDGECIVVRLILFTFLSS